MIQIMSTIAIVMFIIVSILEARQFNSLKRLSDSQAKYIDLLEKRVMDNIRAKNKEFNKKA